MSKSCGPEVKKHSQMRMISLDLLLYLHVPIHSRCQPFLQFAVNRQKFQVNILPFGILITPVLFTRITTPVIRFVHLQVVRLQGYINDSQDKSQIKQNAVAFIELLTYPGFQVHPDKSE